MPLFSQGVQAFYQAKFGYTICRLFFILIFCLGGASGSVGGNAAGLGDCTQSTWNVDGAAREVVRKDACGCTAIRILAVVTMRRDVEFVVADWSEK
jgi:hypothetical protein